MICYKLEILHSREITLAGSVYPESAISSFTNDNKALLRRMFGELQESRPVTQTTVRILTHVVNTGFVAAPLVTTQTFQRFRRDVMEGTLEEEVSRRSLSGFSLLIF